MERNSAWHIETTNSYYYYPSYYLKVVDRKENSWNDSMGQNWATLIKRESPWLQAVFLEEGQP